MAEQGKQQQQDDEKKEPEPGSKEDNLVKLRKKYEQEKKQLQAQIEAEKKAREALEKQQVEEAEQRKKQRIQSHVKRMAKGDEELEAKIEFYLNQFKGDIPDDEKKLEERVENAYTLAAGRRPADTLPSEAISSAIGEPPLRGIEMKGKLGEDALDVAKKLGIKSDELKKHKLI